MTHQNHFKTVGTTDHLIEYNIKITAQNFKEGPTGGTNVKDESKANRN